MKKQKFYWLIGSAVLIAVVVILLVWPINKKISPNLPKVVLIGWDAANRRQVMQLLKEGKLPCLKEISGTGNFIPLEVSGVRDTRASWTVILTGLPSETTGVFSNLFFHPIPKGWSVFERLKKNASPKIITAALISKGRMFRPEKDTPFFYTSHNTDFFITGLEKNKKVVNYAGNFLGIFKNSPFFLFVHFGEIDDTGHVYGENSAEYARAIVDTDRATKKIIQHLKNLGIYEKTLIYITADHGFNESGNLFGHLFAPHIFLATNDPQVKAKTGTNLDITPTILDRYGINWRKIKPALPGRAL